MAALDAVLASPPEALPLTSHAYLYQVAWNLVERAAARQERQAEGAVRARGVREPPLPTDSQSAPDFSSSGAVSGAVDSALAAAPALSSPRCAAEPARVPPPAEFRALLGQLGKALVVPAEASAPAVSPTQE